MRHSVGNSPGLSVDTVDDVSEKKARERGSTTHALPVIKTSPRGDDPQLLRGVPAPLDAIRTHAQRRKPSKELVGDLTHEPNCPEKASFQAGRNSGRSRRRRRVRGRSGHRMESVRKGQRSESRGGAVRCFAPPTDTAVGRPPRVPHNPAMAVGPPSARPERRGRGRESGEGAFPCGAGGDLATDRA